MAIFGLSRLPQSFWDILTHRQAHRQAHRQTLSDYSSTEVEN